MTRDMSPDDTSGYISVYEDSYAATICTDFAELSDLFSAYCEEPGIAQMNVPVWIHFEDGELSVGIMGTRKGECWQYVARATEEQAHSIRARMLSVWAGRADSGFARHYWTTERLEMAARERALA